MKINFTQDMLYKLMYIAKDIYGEEECDIIYSPNRRGDIDGSVLNKVLRDIINYKFYVIKSGANVDAIDKPYTERIDSANRHPWEQQVLEYIDRVGSASRQEIMEKALSLFGERKAGIASRAVAKILRANGYEERRVWSNGRAAERKFFKIDGG